MHLPPRDFITTKEAAKRSGYSADYIAKLARAGEITGRQIGRAWLIDAGSLEGYLGVRENRNADRARSLSAERTQEYRSTRLPVRLAANLSSRKALAPTSVSHARGISLRSAILSRPGALAIALMVVAASASAANAPILSAFAADARTVALEAVPGLADMSQGIADGAALRLHYVHAREQLARADAASGMAHATDAAARPTLLGLARVQDDVHALATAYESSSPGYFAFPGNADALLTPVPHETFAQSLAALARSASPRALAADAADAYIGAGEAGYEAIRALLAGELALIERAGAGALSLGAHARDFAVHAPSGFGAAGSYVASAAHGAIAADVRLAYGISAAGPASARAATVAIDTAGASAARGASVLAGGVEPAFVAASGFPARALPALASRAFALERAAGGRFLGVTRTVSDRYLSFVNAAGAGAYELARGAGEYARTLAEIPAALEDRGLGLLGRSALALHAAPRALSSASGIASIAAAAAPSLSVGEHAAFFTYTFIHTLFASADRFLATLYAPVPTYVASAPSSAAPSSAAAPPRIVYSSPTYTSTTIVRGVSADLLDQSLAALKADLTRQFGALIAPLSGQIATNATTIQEVNMIQDLSNLIVRNGDFRGGTFDGGNVTNAGTVSATTGSFTNLTGGSTTLGTTTISGNLTVNGTFLPGLVNASSAISAPYFSATSTTATSTFAGAFAVGTSSPYGNGLLTVGTSSPLLYIDSATGRIGVGTTTPSSVLTIDATDAIRIPVGTTAQRPSLSMVGQIRYNTTTHQFEGFGDTSVWQGLGGVIDADQSTYITADTNNANEDTLRFFTNSVERMTIGKAGAVGVGSTTPYALLSVSNSAATVANTPLFTIASTTGGTSTSTLMTVLADGRIGVGTTSPWASAAFQIDSAAGGFLPPRVTTAQKTAIAAPVAGLTLYDSTLNKLNVYDGTGWKNVGSTEINGEVTGGTAGSVLFVGDGAVLGQDNANFSYSTSTTRLLLTQASTTRLSNFGTAYFGGTATSTFNSAGVLTLASALGVPSGGTGAAAFGQGWLYSSGGTSALAASTSPTINYLTATSTTLASTFPYASTTALSAGSTNFTTLVGDYATSSVRGALAIYGNTTSGSPSSLTLERGSTGGNNTIIFNDQTGANLLTLGTAGNTGHAALTGYQSFLDLGTNAGGTALSIDTSHNVNATANLIPTANQQYDLGSTADYWRNGYVNNLTVNNLSSASTSIAGTNNTSFSIDSNNPTTDAQDISLVFYRGSGAPSNGVLSWNSTLKRFEFNQNLYVANATASTASTTLQLAAVAGQTAPLTSWLNSSGAVLSTLTSAGFLGIGTSSPYSMLSVAGQVAGQNFVATSTTATSTFAAAITVGAGQGNSTFGGALSINGATGTTTIASGQGFTIGSSQFVVQQGSGNVGIGSNAPARKLAVAGGDMLVNNNGTAADNVLIGDTPGSGFPGIWFGTNATSPSYTNYSFLWDSTLGTLFNAPTGVNGMSFRIANNAVAAINANGMSLGYGNASATTPASGVSLIAQNNVGIGTSSPLTKLSVQGAAGANDVLNIASSTGASLLYVASTGNVGIGTTSPATTLSVAGNGYLTGGLGVGVANTVADSVKVQGADQSGSTASLTVADSLTNALLQVFNNGLTQIKNLLATASSTVGGGTQASGLTVNGGATTTQALVVQGTSASSTFAAGVQAAALNVTSTTATSTFANGLTLGKGCIQFPDGSTSCNSAPASVTLTQVIASSSPGANTSFTVPNNTAYIVVEAWGAGGGGAVEGAPDTGGTGGTTCFGVNSTSTSCGGTNILAATGGSGGGVPNTNVGGPGGTGTGGDVNLTGSPGIGVAIANGGTTNLYFYGENGGSAPGGGGGGRGNVFGTNGDAGSAFGGGGGGVGPNNTSGTGGGSGGGGGGYSKKILTSPSGTYYYTVGAGGAGGTTGGTTGGAGGAGGVIIYVYTTSTLTSSGSAVTLTRVISASTAQTNTTYTPPSNISYIAVEVWGGGGSGAVNAVGGGGGGGAGYAQKTIANPSGTYYYTIGAGGAGSTGAGNTGGASCFQTTNNACSSGVLAGANGGGPGDTGGGGGPGGAGTTGDVLLTGLSGGTSRDSIAGATGGSAPRGGGGGSGLITGGNAGAPYGGGSGGAVNGTSAAGGAGGITIYEYTTSALQAVGTQGQAAYFTGSNTSAGTSTITIGTNSNVGIGSSSPSAKLAVQGIDQSSATNALSITDSLTNALLTVFDNGLTQLKDLIATASSTIGGGTQASGLTVNGGATTTQALVVQGAATSTFANGLQLTSGCFLLPSGQCAGTGSGSSVTLTQVIASSSPGSNTSFTVPTNTAYIVVEVWGGGGGGRGGGSSPGAGTSGGTSCFGTSNAQTDCTQTVTLKATGGAAGATINAGGSGSGGDINMSGGSSGGTNTTSGTNFLAGGYGGSAPRGGGGGGTDFGSAGGAGAAFGGGGGGGGDNGVVGSGTGNGAGGAGGGYSQKIITNPSGTYYYTVGAGGSGGTAGTSGFAGGAGGAGGITIYVYTTAALTSSGSGVTLTRVLTSTSGTNVSYTPPSNISYIVVQTWGGGGGGGGADSGTSGVDGGQSCFSNSSTSTACSGVSGPIISATGGGKGAGAAGGTGGAGSGGDVNLAGSGASSPSTANATSITNYFGGTAGGSAPRGGGGGAGALYSSGNGLPGGAFGGGGGGGGVNGTNNAFLGGAGGGGGGYAQKTITNPSGTYYYTIGAGGAGGVGATNGGVTGTNGGAGGAGGIEIDEYTTGAATAGSVGSGTQGQTAFYNAAGSNLTATSSIFLATSGNVGIGTSTPTNNLYVTTATSAGGISIDGSLNPALTLDATSTTKAILGLATAAGSFATGAVYGDVVLRTSGGKLFFDTNTGVGTPSVTISGGNGNVGIGTTTPLSAYALDVNGTLGTLSNANNAGAYLGTGAGYGIVAAINAINTLNQPLAVQPFGGNVGIGTTTPQSTLVVQSSSNATSTPTSFSGTQLDLFDSANAYGQMAGIRMHTGSGWNVQLRTSQSDNWLELTNGAGTINQSWYGQNYYPGASSNAGTNAGYITGDGTHISIGAITFANSSIGVAFDGATGGARVTLGSGDIWSMGRSDVDGTVIQFTRAGVSVGSISVTSSATAYNTTSDRRLKENIATTTAGLATLLQIPVDDFNFISDPSQTRVQGFIAQDLYKYYPEAVTTNGDNGLVPLGATSTPWEVDYGRLTPLLARSIQDLSGKVDSIALTATTTASIHIDAAGNVGVGTTTPAGSAFAYNLTVAGSVGAEDFVNYSSRELKTNINAVDASTTESILGEIASTTVYTYNYKDEAPGTPLHIGLITDSAPSAVLSAGGGGVDLYKLASFTLAGVQALAAKVDSQEMRLTSLESRVAALESGAVSMATSTSAFSGSTLASALKNLGILVAQGIAQFDTVVAHRFVALAGADGSASAGTATIPAAATSTLVTNSLVAPSTKVFVTFNSAVAGPWWVSDKADGSFRVALAAPQTSAVSFDYFLVQTELPAAQGGGAGATSTASAAGANSGAPITLLGDNPVHLSVGGTYVEPGVEVASGAPYKTFINGVEQAVSSTTIDTSAPTTYIITYTASDSSGQMVSALRSVIVGNPDGTVSTGGSAAASGGSSATSASTTPPASGDTTPPVVTLLGAAAINLAQGGTWTDPGATALDGTDGDLTKKIVESGALDTATPGLYTLTYTVADAAGNTGSASRVVTVIAASAPSAATTTTASSTTP